MPRLAEHRIRVTYTGGLANENLLPAYDGATSIDGITRALQIATHAYMTGEVVTRATALRNASLVMKPARQGSFIVDFFVYLEANPATTGAATALLAAPFYDFIKTVFSRAIGHQDAEPQTPQLAKLYTRLEPPPLMRQPADLDELAETLEGSLQAAHRPIGEEDGAISQISLGTPRNDLVLFDRDSKDWVNTREEAAGIELFNGNVTRFNSLSRNGRGFIDQFERVLPIRPGPDFQANDLAMLTWSLHGSNIGGHKKLEMRARRVSSASGKVKRLLLVQCNRMVGELA